MLLKVDYYYEWEGFKSLRLVFMKFVYKENKYVCENQFSELLNCLFDLSSTLKHTLYPSTIRSRNLTFVEEAIGRIDRDKVYSTAVNRRIGDVIKSVGVEINGTIIPGVYHNGSAYVLPEAIR